MTHEEFNTFCRALPATTYVIQWGGSHVWKIGGEVFAIASWRNDDPSFTFKVSDISYEMLREQRGLRPAPYLASRGLKWIQHYARPGLSDAELRESILYSYTIVTQNLPKKKRSALGFDMFAGFFADEMAEGRTPNDTRPCQHRSHRSERSQVHATGDLDPLTADRRPTGPMSSGTPTRPSAVTAAIMRL